MVELSLICGLKWKSKPYKYFIRELSLDVVSKLALKQEA